MLVLSNNRLTNITSGWLNAPASLLVNATLYLVRLDNNKISVSRDLSPSCRFLRFTIVQTCAGVEGPFQSGPINEEVMGREPGNHHGIMQMPSGQAPSNLVLMSIEKLAMNRSKSAALSALPCQCSGASEQDVSCSSAPDERLHM